MFNDFSHCCLCLIQELRLEEEKQNVGGYTSSS